MLLYSLDFLVDTQAILMSPRWGFSPQCHIVPLFVNGIGLFAWGDQKAILMSPRWGFSVVT